MDGTDGKMSISIRRYQLKDLPRMTEIWNHVVEEGNAFPQLDGLTAETSQAFFDAQSYVGVADENGRILGLYILHPNNIGRCGHIANASYAVDAGLRGKGVGRSLVQDCMIQARKLGFRILQFNAVVATNLGAIHLYEKLGFHRLGTIEQGFLKPDGAYEDIIVFYIPLTGQTLSS
jgi:L-amino acid N-acyltransferase YncA